ncbi:hypothetical protein [Nocardia sienata]|uniref:hypothetical protein n=1 Tax=Nocardia sienata TaxID=248552 RepID=UPI000AFC7E73|nr:hypothetical protein [Nocardia sienata]
MSYPGGQPPQGLPAPGQFPPPPQQYAPPAPNQVGQPQYPGGPQGGPQPWGAPPPGQPPQGFGQPAAQPQYASGPYAQPPGQPPAQFGPGGQPGPYGQPPLAAPNDPPGITVDCSYAPIAFLLAITKPKITVNGQRVPNTRWGANHIPVGPGQYHVRVTTPWLFDMGPADVAVPVQPGQAVRYYYRTPALIFLNGAIGPVPQKTPGMVVMYVIWAFVALIFLLNILMIATM